ncbi:MAG: hypothetical protein H8E55_65445 [Pelagibacterales bacterium]|nr:hypothetical protein [Pelagibacterales bacterium]
MNNQQPQMNVDFSQTTGLTCDECENETFTQVFYIRKLSALLSPSGEESLIPVPTFQCSSCNHVNDSLKPHQ